ncbi:MAG: hypothetical protein ACRDKS_12405 [Actinomycetota bacterium]
MAIKGKRRTRARGAALPPRPVVPARKTPLAARRDVKRVLVIVLAVLAMLGGLRVWQNDSRAEAVRVFNRKLIAAQEPLIKHLIDGAAATSVPQSLEGFKQGTVTGKQFFDLSTVWEADFRKAKEAVDALKAPNDVAEEAKKLFVQGLDGYVGIARLYNLAALMKQIAEAEKDPARKTQWEEKAQVLVSIHADEMRQRADAVYTIGQQMFDDLKDRYSVEPKIDTGSSGTGGQ